MPVTHASIPMPNPAVFSRHIAAETMLVNADNAASLLLNATGYHIWQLINGQRTVSAIIAEFSGQFSAPPPSLAADVVALITSLAEDDFVIYQSESAG